MPRNPNHAGGGARTNENGLAFEQTTSLNDALNDAGYVVRGCEVYKDEQLIGLSVPKYKVYSQFLKKRDVDYKEYNSKQWLPDECFINLINKTAYIIEKKFQHSHGSVDEKLPGCHFKKKEYEKLFVNIDFKVEYLYVFNDWFSMPIYIDTLKYIKDMGCHYYFNKIPLEFLCI